MLKIAILVSLFPPKNDGGVELATYYIAEHLQARGNEVHVITSRDKGMPREDVYKGVTVHRLYWPRLGVLGWVLLQLNMFFAVRRVDPELIHIQSFSLSLCGLLIRRVSNKPYIVAGHGSDVYRPPVKGPIFLASLREKVRSNCIKNASAVTAVTEHMKNRIQDDYATESIVVPNGIELGIFDSAPTKEEARERLQLEREASVIICIGNLRAVKGTAYLIRAINLIQQKESSIRLLIVGKGEEEVKLRALAEKTGVKERVIFMGSIPHHAVPQYLAASDVFVLPSLSEGFPLVSLEAMAAALPIVATKVGGIPSVVKEGVNGFLVNPRDAAQIAEKVLFILNDQKLRHCFSENNRNKAKQYTWGMVATKLETVYQSCLKT